MKSIKIVVITACFWVFLGIVALPAKAMGGNPPNNEMLSIAKKVALNELNILVGRQALNETAIKQLPGASQETLSQTVSRVEALNKAGISYTDYEFNIAGFISSEDAVRAVITVSEDISLTISGEQEDPSRPLFTMYSQQRVLTFKKVDHGIMLENNQLVFTLNLTGVNDMTSDGVENPQTIPEITDPATGMVPDSVMGSESANKILSPNSVNANKSAIVSYAKAYAKTRNSSYYDWGDNDCTNFASQAMRYGGWATVNDFLGGYYNDDRNWYYNYPVFLSKPTNSWVNVTGFWNFAQFSNRASVAFVVTGCLCSPGNVFRLNPGDILQADWQNDGKWDHTMIVTGKDSASIYLTYHTVWDSARRAPGYALNLPWPDVQTRGHFTNGVSVRGLYIK